MVSEGDVPANILIEKLWTYGENMKFFENVGFYSEDGFNWSNVDKDTNICIKAFTDFADVNKAESTVNRGNETVNVEKKLIKLTNADNSVVIKPYHFGGLYPDWVDTITNDFISDIELPEKYDLRELNQVTDIKNQGSFALCSAFGAVSSLESGVLKRMAEGPLTPGDNNNPNAETIASIIYHDGKIYANSSKDASLYIAFFDGSNRLTDIVIYPIEAGVEKSVSYEIDSKCKAFLWDENLVPLCEGL